MSKAREPLPQSPLVAPGRPVEAQVVAAWVELGSW